MQVAGTAVAFELRDDAAAWELSEAVYRAMEQERHNAHSDPSAFGPSRNLHHSGRAFPFAPRPKSTFAVAIDDQAVEASVAAAMRGLLQGTA